jgi:Tol biopolymer transport system component
MKRSARATTVAMVMSLALAPAAASAAVGRDASAGEQPWIAYQTSFHEATGFGPEGVWLIHPDGTDDHQVGLGAHDEQALPSWSPDGRKLVFTTRGGDHEPLFEYSLASDRARQLFRCEGSCLGDDEPAYSPDGRTVVFVRAFGPLTAVGPADCSLWLGDVATGKVRRLTDNSSCDREVMPRWSPDGTRLTYYRERYDPVTLETAATAVFVLRIATGQETRLTEWADDYGEPDWSPDGRSIVMASHPLHSFNFGSYSSNLFLIRPDGSGLRPLTGYVGDQRATQPRYTPDGRSIVFTAVSPTARELWIIPAAGGTTQRVTQGGIATHGTMQPEGPGNQHT